MPRQERQGREKWGARGHPYFPTGLETLLLLRTKSTVQLIPIEQGSRAWPCASQVTLGRGDGAASENLRPPLSPAAAPWGPSDGSSLLEDTGRATQGIILKVDRSLSLASVSHHRPAVMLRGGFLGNDTAAEPTLCEPSIRAFLLFLDLQGVLRRVTRKGCRWGGGLLRSGWDTRLTHSEVPLALAGVCLERFPLAPRGCLS